MEACQATLWRRDECNRGQARSCNVARKVSRDLRYRQNAFASKPAPTNVRLMLQISATPTL
jgi:hypothetical protein